MEPIAKEAMQDYIKNHVDATLANRIATDGLQPDAPISEWLFVQDALTQYAVKLLGTNRKSEAQELLHIASRVRSRL